MNRKITVFTFTLMFLIYGITSFGYTDEADSAHFHEESTTRYVTLPAVVGTNVGDPVQAHSVGTHDRYRFRDRNNRFSLNPWTGQLTIKASFDQIGEENTMTVNVLRQEIEAVGEHFRIVSETQMDSIEVVIEEAQSAQDPNPGPVQRLRQVATEGSNIVIRWGPPLNTGSSLISHYEMRHNSGTAGYGDWFSIGAVLRVNLPAKETDRYFVQVRAVNTDGHAGDPDTLENLTLANGKTLGPDGEDLLLVGQADALPGVSSEERSRIAGALAMDRVIFNELRNAMTDAHDWVELRNITDVDVPLDGWEVRIVTGETTATVTFPSGTVLPAGGLLLLVNTDPDAPEMPLSMPEEAVYLYVVDEGLILPQAHFTLLLRSPTSWEDSVGNFFFGYEIPPTAPPLTTDAAWYRARPDALGYQSEAWVTSGYQEGIGYDEGVPEAGALGTPGHPQSSLMGDVNGDGIVNILDLVWVASRFDTTDAPDADLNGDGEVNLQDLVLVANRLGSIAAAPSAQTLHASHVQQWLASAKQAVADSGIETASAERLLSYERGLQVLEQLLATLVPKSTALLANYPNPFNPETWIPYRLAKSSDVQLRIYDTQGRMVRHLELGHQAAGVYQTRSQAAYWDGRNEMGESVASGLYFYTLMAGEFSATRRMLILK